MVIPQIEGQPFSGRLVVQLTSRWPDGTTLRSGFYNVVARDSAGRVHQEKRRIVPEGSEKESFLTEFTIFDTPSRTRIRCEVATRICVLTGFSPLLRIVDPPEGLSRDGKYYLTREKLGSVLWNNLPAEHTLETLTANAGEEGNTRATNTVREYWFSPELQINLAVKRNFADDATQQLQLTDLRTEEPDPSLFVPPANYFMDDQRRNHGGGR